MQVTNADSDFDSRVGAYLRERRLSKGISQREVAERLGKVGLPLDPTAITRIEKGTRPIRLEEASAIANVLDTGLEQILMAVNDKAEMVRQARDRANSSMHDARFAAWEFLYQVQKVREGLVDAPSALPGIDAEDYYEWVLNRLVHLTAIDEEHWAAVYETNERDAALLEQLVKALTTNMVIVGEPPPEEEGEDGEHPEEA